MILVKEIQPSVLPIWLKTLAVMKNNESAYQCLEHFRRAFNKGLLARMFLSLSR